VNRTDRGVDPERFAVAIALPRLAGESPVAENQAAQRRQLVRVVRAAREQSGAIVAEQHFYPDQPRDDLPRRHRVSTAWEPDRG